MSGSGAVFLVKIVVLSFCSDSPSHLQHVDGRAGLENGGSKGSAAPAEGLEGAEPLLFANVLASRQAKVLKKGCAVLVVINRTAVQWK